MSGHHLNGLNLFVVLDPSHFPPLLVKNAEETVEKKRRIQAEKELLVEEKKIILLPINRTL